MAGSAPKSHARRTLLVLATISITAAMLVVLVPAARATTCRVGNPTVGIHSSDLQAMIDASSPGHTLRLSGTCVGNLTFSKISTYSGCVLIRRSTGTQVDRC